MSRRLLCCANHESHNNYSHHHCHSNLPNNSQYQNAALHLKQQQQQSQQHPSLEEVQIHMFIHNNSNNSRQGQTNMATTRMLNIPPLQTRSLASSFSQQQQQPQPEEGHCMSTRRNKQRQGVRMSTWTISRSLSVFTTTSTMMTTMMMMMMMILATTSVLTPTHAFTSVPLSVSSSSSSSISSSHGRLGTKIKPIVLSSVHPSRIMSTNTLLLERNEVELEQLLLERKLLQQSLQQQQSKAKPKQQQQQQSQSQRIQFAGITTTPSEKETKSAIAQRRKRMHQRRTNLATTSSTTTSASTTTTPTVQSFLNSKKSDNEDDHTPASASLFATTTMTPKSLLGSKKTMTTKPTAASTTTTTTTTTTKPSISRRSSTMPGYGAPTKNQLEHERRMNVHAQPTDQEQLSLILQSSSSSSSSSLTNNNDYNANHHDAVLPSVDTAATTTTTTGSSSSSPSSNLVVVKGTTHVPSSSAVRKNRAGEAMYQACASVPDSLVQFAKELHQEDRITPHEELELGRLTQEAIQLQSIHDCLQLQLHRDPTDDEWCAAAGKINMEAIRQTISEGMEAKNKLVMANLRMVQGVVNVYIRNGLSGQYNAGDMMQEGVMALIRAAEKFEPQRGFRFSTYAMYWIRSAVKRSQTYQSRVITIPQRLYANQKRVKLAQKQLQYALGRPATKQELAQAVDMTPSQLDRCLLSMEQRCYSLDQQLNPRNRGMSSDSHREDTMYDIVESKADTGDKISRTLLREDLIESLYRTLDQESAHIIMLRYGLVDDYTILPKGYEGPLTIAQVSQLVGMKPDKVRRRIIKSLKELQQSIGNEWRDYDRVME